MGRGIIMSGGTGGQYQVELVLSRSRVQENITELNAQIVLLDIRIAEAEEGHAKELLELQKAALEKRKSYLETKMPKNPVISAWCADLTEDLSGVVGTIEIPGERGAVNIQPGYDGNAAYDDERDGQLQPAVGSRSASATFYNWAMLPGWQKWMPTYRYGTITSIDYDNDLCDVVLHDAESSQQRLGVNYLSSLSNVPIEYMTSNSNAFGIGDKVIVRFEGVSKTQTKANWDNPKVIGFKRNPGEEVERLFVAVAELSTGDRVMTSPNGEDWTIQEAPLGIRCYDVCWSPELKLLVAVGNGDPHNVMTSSDGLGWTGQSSGLNNNWLAVCWSPELGLFVATCTDESHVMTSSNGISWTAQGIPESGDWEDICWSPGAGLFVATNADGYMVMTSPNGEDWTLREGLDQDCQCICWSPKLELFVVLYQDCVLRSSNGVDWTACGAVPEEVWYSVCWSPELELFAAAGDQGSIMTSSNGINWTVRATSDGRLRGICWSPEKGLFVAVGYRGPDSVITSSNGIDWVPQIAPDRNWVSVCWAGGI